MIDFSFKKWLTENTVEKYSQKYFTAQEEKNGDSISITLLPTPFFTSGVHRKLDFFKKQVNEMKGTLKLYMSKFNDAYWEELKLTIPWKEYINDSEGDPGNAQGYLAKAALDLVRNRQITYINKKNQEGLDALTIVLSRPGQPDYRPTDAVPEDYYAL